MSFRTSYLAYSKLVGTPCTKIEFLDEKHRFVTVCIIVILGSFQFGKIDDFEVVWNSLSRRLKKLVEQSNPNNGGVPG